MKEAVSRLEALRSLNNVLLKRLHGAESAKGAAEVLNQQLSRSRADLAAAELAATSLRAELACPSGMPEALAACESRLGETLARHASLGAEVAQLSARLEQALGAASECVSRL